MILFNQDIAPGTRGGAGFVTQGVYEIVLEARPGNIPQSLEADCIVLESFDDAILASDLELPEGAVLAGDPEERIAWIQPPRVIEEDLIDEEEVEGEEGEEGEGEAEGRTRRSRRVVLLGAFRPSARSVCAFWSLTERGQC